ncbi:MAG: hypothetical protein QOJ86_5041 [Bradyrhizobium sp.]|nr:hypothetical protein [Bradyrhizobium sp.]
MIPATLDGCGVVDVVDMSLANDVHGTYSFPCHINQGVHTFVQPFDTVKVRTISHFMLHRCWAAAQGGPNFRRSFELAGHDGAMDRYGHLFRSDSQALALDAISTAIETRTSPEAPKHAHRSTADLVRS